MENNIQIFSNEEYGEIRTTTLNGEIAFIAADACRALEIKNVSDALSNFDEDEKGIATVYTLGGEQKMLVVTEYGLYRLVFMSRKPNAKAFRRWIWHEVIPSIRKTGSYVGAAITPALLRRLADELERSQVTAAKPAVQLEVGLTRTWTVTAIANEYDMSAQWLNRTLWELGIQRRSGSTWRLTASALREMRRRGEEWIIIAQYERELADGSIKYGAPYMRWTDAGRRYIHEMLTAQGIERKWVE